MPERAYPAQSECTIGALDLVHVGYHWTMVEDRAIAGPFDTPAEARKAGRGIFGAWVQSGAFTASKDGHVMTSHSARAVS